MSRPDLLLAIDQGTSSTRALVFDLAGAVVAVRQRPLSQHYPREGWVEHDAEEIWSATVSVCRDAIADVDAGRIAAVGITNQRETCLLWDRRDGKPLHRAIVWQDRRGAEACRALEENGHAGLIRRTTGLVVDSYFSATKLAWLLDNVPGAREKATAGDLAFGTIDTFLLWRLTGGRVHSTDATNASRTMLFDIHAQRWNPELCDLFHVPLAVLPEVRDCVDDFGTTSRVALGLELPIRGVAGDQHAALIGQGCIAPGAAKATYGTGCFLLTNEGSAPPTNVGALLTTVAYRLSGKTTFATEGAVFNAGTAIAWLRDSLGIIADSHESEALAAGLDDNGGVYFVPAFTGLGAPYWEPRARGIVAGLGRDTTRAHLARAALEASAYQTRDLLTAAARPAEVLRIDGGMAANNWFAQFLADVLDTPVARPVVTETTARGAALLAGIGAGLYDNLEEGAATWRADRTFIPAMAARQRQALLDGWQQAIRQVRAAYT
jgi:glycerol kinase